MRRLAITAAIIAGVVDGLYLGVARSQPGPANAQFLTVPFVAAFIALLAIAAALSARGFTERIRPALLALSAAGLLAVGYVGMLSIGLPLLVAGVLALIAAILSLATSPRPATALQALAGVLVAAILFVGGFSLTPRAIACPPTGFESGSGQGFLLGGAYHYTCANGKLTVKDGFCSSAGASVDPSGRVISVSDC